MEASKLRRFEISSYQNTLKWKKNKHMKTLAKTAPFWLMFRAPRCVPMISIFSTGKRRQRNGKDSGGGFELYYPKYLTSEKRLYYYEPEELHPLEPVLAGSDRYVVGQVPSGTLSS
jgi:hypothetical protein